MKKVGKFYRNPAPFALTAINPAKRKAVKKKFRARSRKRNMLGISRVLGAASAAKTLLKNSAHKKRRRRKRNPLEIQHVIASVPARNPSRKKRSKFSHRNPMKTNKKRRSRRNPARKQSRGRFHSRRNPSRKRSRMMRRRNPIPVVTEIFTQDNVLNGLGVLLGVAGTRYLVNKLIQGDPTTGQRMFDLPGVTYSTATAPLTQAQFSQQNKVALAFYEAAIPAVAGWLAQRYNGPISRGLFQSTIVNLGIFAIRNTHVGQTAGLGAFLPRQRSLRTFIPGVPPQLSGPATAFINNGAPVPARNGMSAVVNGAWSRRTATQVADPFRRS